MNGFGRRFVTLVVMNIIGAAIVGGMFLGAGVNHTAPTLGWGYVWRVTKYLLGGTWTLVILFVAIALGGAIALLTWKVHGSEHGQRTVTVIVAVLLVALAGALLWPGSISVSVAGAIPLLALLLFSALEALLTAPSRRDD